MRIDTQAVDTTRSAPERFRSAVGNDVVDLAHPRCGDRPREDPLLRRILAPGEREWLEDGGPTWSRPLRLWACWASKEAAYKVHTQAGFERGRTFRPSLLSCDLRFVEEGDGPAMALRGRVLLDGLEDGAVEVEGTSDGESVHVVGWSAEGPLPRRGRLECGVERSDGAPLDGFLDADVRARLDAVRDRFTAAEWEGIRTPASAMVRILARGRIEQHLRSRGESGRIEIVTPSTSGFRRPPRVRLDGRELPELGVSLSHHGRFLAWAILIEPKET